MTVIGGSMVVMAMIGMLIVTFEATVGGSAVGFRLTALSGSVT
jgi:hypothetical protein